jgi:hypothetical protein
MPACPNCNATFDNPRRIFCSRECKNKWHNDRQIWSERADREQHNARKKARYQADPETARQRMRDWRAANPGLQKEIERRNRIKNAENIKQQSAEWRARNREHLQDRSKLFHYETRKNTPWKHIMRSRFRDAIKRGIPFTLTDEWAAKKWTGRCELTDIPFALNNTSPGFYSPSIDKIKPELGYTPENCRFILLAVNSFKNTGTDADVFAAAKAILRYRDKVVTSESSTLKVISPGTR